ncbi:MAG: primosomal protein N' [Marinovum sp.]|nr:primosomal protein N' [Marinovum sp.]
MLSPWKTPNAEQSVQQAAFFQQDDLISVITTQPIERALDYRAPEGGCFDGAYVEVPLGPRKVLGVVWGAGQGGYDAAKIRPVLRVLDVAPMTPEMKLFLQRAADYTVTPFSAMLRLATRAPGLSDPPSMRKIYYPGNIEAIKKTKARERVLDVFDTYGGAGFTLKELAGLAGVSTSVIKGMLPSGAVVEKATPRDRPFARLNPDKAGKKLTTAQSAATDRLDALIKQDAYSTALLRGVTGSGKTEVYLEAVAQTLRQGQQALVLLPEIALTGEFLQRVESRFGVRPAEWHSGVTMTERRRIWKMVGQGQAELVVGARSALFLPFRSLGLIVVDEEHDSSYKQQDGVRYHARDMAVLRASIAGAKVVLASATPSLESWTNAGAGKYHRIDLTDRFGPSVLPTIETIDMRLENLPSNRWISDTLAAQVKTRLGRSEQVLLFLNRRGYAPITLCRACGTQIGCTQCDARMVEHRFLNRLVCHQCGDSQAKPTSCPSCHAEDKLAPVGPGVERLAEETAELFPEARVVTLSSDMFGTARALKEQIKEIAEGAADIIIGTQLVAKGHNFPKLTLVGVIDADLGLHGSDLRAAERTFQLMRQVAGRAGRAEKPGVALLQTHQPEHPVITSILTGNEEEFWDAEAQARQDAAAPPFGRMIGIIISASNPEAAFEFGTRLAQNAQPLQAIGAQIFGPASAPIARIRGRHRVRLLIKCDKAVPVQAAIRQWLQALAPKGDLRLAVDIDPQSFL